MASAAGVRGRVYSVSELQERLRGLIEAELPSLWVEGELSSFTRPASGHWYFTLKDARAQLRCVMFKGQNYTVRPVPAEGDRVRLRGSLSIYPARGDLQLIVEALEPAGQGDLLLAFEQLKRRLAAEGLFDPALKRPLPLRPQRLGLITSASGAALHDVLTTLQRRAPLLEVTLWPVPVQGSEAPAAIIAALAGLPRRAPVELILLVRGGGSIEDLQAFNDEALARAIRGCAVPVISGVGHEVDLTIADFVADCRAATPTAAAELASPDLHQLAADAGLRLESAGRRLQRRLQQHMQALDALDQRRERQHPRRRLSLLGEALSARRGRLHPALNQHLARAAERLRQRGLRLQAQHPGGRIEPARQALQGLERRLQAALALRLEQSRQALAHRQSLLASLHPEAVLARGYAVVRDAHGRVLRDAAAVFAGEHLALQLARGQLSAQVLGAPEPPA
ncbi:MAG TPA: exodeoxyribonuclease VII large subunit [Nevskiaceae bacterium]|nr:exodeoxyribonuclease VII large subunit [Nevskiaceae bacterium]